MTLAFPGLVSLVVILSMLCIVNEADSQWRRLASFPQVVNCVLPMDSGKPSAGTIFVGTNGLHSLQDEAVLWRSTDGGRSWIKVFTASSSYEAAVSSLCFANNSTGWMSLRTYFAVAGLGGVLKTTDGGNTWSKLDLDSRTGDCAAVYYHGESGKLFVSRWGDLALSSSDLGSSWQQFGNPAPALNLTGYLFLDEMRGIATSVEPGNRSRLYSTYHTTDGGFTWDQGPLMNEIYQPSKIGSSILALGDLDSTVYRSDDLGLTWIPMHTFPLGMIGTLQADSSQVFAQSGGLDFDNRNGPAGLYSTRDTGLTWLPVCGPSNWFDTRFYASDYGIWAGDHNGTLWVNRTKKPNADRLQLGMNNSHHLVVGSAGKAVRVPIYYTSSQYYEAVDSLTFILDLSDALWYDHDSVAYGWSVERRELQPSSAKITLRRTDPSTPDPDSLILVAYVRTYLTTEHSATIALDEINFNQDTTFRECMVASLTKNDSLFVDIQDDCGDSILREFIRTDGKLRIESVRPNPASSEVTVDVRAGMNGEAEVEFVNALGAVVYSGTKLLVAGENTIRIATREFAGGVYYLRLWAGGGVCGQSVIIER